MSGGCLEGVWKVSGWCLDGVWKVFGPKICWTKYILGPKFFWGHQFFFVSTHTNQTKPNQIGPELGTAQPQLVLIILSFGLVRSRRESKGAIGCQVLLLFTEESHIKLSVSEYVCM